MNIIPVLDLKAGQVVHAKHGNRQNYLPIQSALSDSSEPLTVVRALQSLYPFKLKIYKKSFPKWKFG